MSALAGLYSIDRKVFSSAVKRCNSFSFRWRDLVAPNFGYGFGRLSWEQTFVILEHLMQKFQDQRAGNSLAWTHGGPIDQLNASSGIGSTGMSPLGTDWEAELRKRFQYLLLAYPRSSDMADMAEQLGYDNINNQYWIRQRTYRRGQEVICNATTHLLITSLFRAQGKTSAPLNRCHKRARTVFSAGVYFNSGTSIGLTYGYASERKSGSSWGHIVATRNKGELMLDFLIRGAAAMQEVVTGYQSPCPQPDPKAFE